MKSDESKLPLGTYEGMWTRIMCSVCEAYFYIEDDVPDGDVLDCEECGETLCVERVT